VFEQFVKRPRHLAQYRNGPYAEERSRFVERLVQEGRCVGRLKALNWSLARALPRRRQALEATTCNSQTWSLENREDA
jgi:hypothetical protein